MVFLTSTRNTFFLSGYYGQGNLGDDLLLRATIEGICRISPVRRFIVRNEGDVAGLNGLSVPIELTGIDKIAADQARSKFSRLVSTLVVYRRYLRQCDWFIFGGGTVFHERLSVVPLIMTFLVCLLARLMGVRIAALGVGVAAMHSMTGRFLLRLIIALSDIFAVRDDAALAECVRAGSGNKVILTADIVFTMTASLREAGQKSAVAGTPLIGISVYAPVLFDQDEGNRVFETMREALQTVLTRGWRVALLAFHHKRDDSDARLDRAALVRLAKCFPERYQSQITLSVLEADDAAGIADTFSELNIHCGMRFHGHVLSAIFEKPFVGMSVDNKINAICRLFKMPVVQLDQFSSEDIVKAIDQAMANRIDSALRAKCEEGATRNFQQLAACIAASQSAAKS